MELRLPRRPRFAAHQPTREAGSRPPAADDPWAGEDDDWTGDVAGESQDHFLRFFRGLVWGLVVGIAFWALAVVALVLLLG
jgi:hypothetical protein